MDGVEVYNWIMGGGVLTVVGFAIATYVRTDKQIGRVYERLDEKTDSLKKDSVSKEVCDVVHKSVDATLQEIKQKVDCIPKIKAGLDTLLRKNGLSSGD